MHVENKYIDNTSFNLPDGIIWEETDISSQFLKCEKIKDSIIITTNYVGAPRIAYVISDKGFAFSLNRKKCMDFLDFSTGCGHEHISKEELSEPIKYFKRSVISDYLIPGINFIENWQSVTIHSDGTFEKIDYPLKPYSIDLKNSYDIIRLWLLKYKRIVNQLIDEKRFIPTISGGLDTRILSSIYRDRTSEIDSYYLRDVKLDGKNNIELGKADLEVAKKVAQRLGIQNRVTEIPENMLSLSGMYSEMGRGFYRMNVNDPEFIYKFIQHRSNSTSIIQIFNDDLFLCLKHPAKKVMRAMLVLLLCKDLMDIECIGDAHTFKRYNKKPYNFYEEYKNEIPQAQEILDYWGEDKCKHILND